MLVYLRTACGGAARSGNAGACAARYALLAVIGLTARTAAADGAADALVGRPLVLGPGELVAQLVVEADLAQLARPLSLAPDAWLGVTPRLTVGLITSDAALDLVDDGADLCIRHSPFFGCTNHGTGIDARYAVNARFAPRIRVLERSIQPGKPAVALGALVRAVATRRFDLVVDPYLQIGLYNTDMGNASALVVPVLATLQILAPVAATLETGYITDLDVWQDGFHIPLSLTITGRVVRHVEVAAQAGFTSLAGPQNNIKQREGWLIVRYLAF